MNFLGNHHNFGACFMFWEKADSSACCGSIGDGEEADTVADDGFEEDGGVRNGGGGKDKWLKGNWWGRAKPASGEWDRRASCLEEKDG